MEKEKDDGKIQRVKIQLKTKLKHSFILGLQQKYLSMFNLGTTPLSALNTPVSF